MKAMCSWQTIRSRRCVDRRCTPPRPPGAAGRRCPAAARAATGPGSRPHRARGAVLAFAADRGQVKAGGVEVRQRVRVELMRVQWCLIERHVVIDELAEKREAGRNPRVSS